MERLLKILSIRLLLISVVLLTTVNVKAQNDSLANVQAIDTLSETLSDTIHADVVDMEKLSKKELKRVRRDSIRLARELKRASWSPDPKKAMWLAIVLPGAGQIYNRKYWKLPIIYGGFVGCVYAMTWNDMMYHDYSQAYVDIMDNDPNTQSYNQFLHLGGNINEANADRYKTLFKKRKDFYRRYRDLSFFCLIGVYALSVIDAYVDASLSQFDISKDISLRVAPAVIREGKRQGSLSTSSVGVQCSLSF